ncbi:MAG TPA: hypothetical protein VGK32_04975 [Vicinamibacterales bacterium]|jgi:hypothetical protein
MRSRSLLCALTVLLSASPALAADANGVIEHALGPYYAALVASSRGNIDATNRQLILFASRWASASREVRTTPPAEIGQDPEWPVAVDRVTTLIAEARAAARRRDMSGAHADLEEVRQVLREVRERHQLATFDDHLSDYHEAVERVAGHVVGRNEIRLTGRDFDDINEDLQSALQAWRAAQGLAGPIAASATWKAAAAQASAALAQMAKALAAKDRTAIAHGADRLKTTYYDLLLAVSIARG